MRPGLCVLLGGAYISLANNTDLDFLPPGDYFSQATTNTETMLNKPSDIAGGFRMHVFVVAGSKNYVVQEIIQQANYERVIRWQRFIKYTTPYSVVERKSSWLHQYDESILNNPSLLSPLAAALKPYILE